MSDLKKGQCWEMVYSTITYRFIMLEDQKGGYIEARCYSIHYPSSSMYSLYKINTIYKLHVETLKKFATLINDCEAKADAEYYVSTDGCKCKKCKVYYKYSEPNQEDGTYICYGCRS